MLPLARSTEIRPVDLIILAASSHTHALGMASCAIVMGLLAALTSLPRVLVGLVVAGTGVGLLADISSWWLMREGDWVIMTGNENFAWMTMIGGGMFTFGLSILGLMVLLDLCLPGSGRRASTTG